MNADIDRIRDEWNPAPTNPAGADNDWVHFDCWRDVHTLLSAIADRDARIAELEALVVAVGDLHEGNLMDPGMTGYADEDRQLECLTCRTLYPCETIRALDDEGDSE